MRAELILSVYARFARGGRPACFPSVVRFREQVLIGVKIICSDDGHASLERLIWAL